MREEGMAVPRALYTFAGVWPTGLTERLARASTRRVVLACLPLQGSGVVADFSQLIDREAGRSCVAGGAYRRC